ncbi:MAG TPA: L-threonylcarbamoyladenylate synthase [Blastocatellia bacterium]|nr:L-threonylcarbamoyladenylate synthase [Blastocatellia bacterium]
MTQVLQLDPNRPQKEAIERAASIIREGGLVAFPTETVYGLGADATNESAVRRIFEAKARPADNPVIVHVGDREMLNRVANGVDGKAELLIQKFWPGPLTLVLRRKPDVAPSVSAGLSTVAVRMPRNNIALALVRRARTPIAAPSANLSGSPSPTTAEHVVDDLSGRIDLILDGGPTNIGIESTVLDLTTDPPVILRPGWITEQMLTELIGPIGHATSDEERMRSPGTRHRHYSPRARVVLIEPGSPESVEDVCRKHLSNGSVGFIGHTDLVLDDPSFRSIRVAGNVQDYAHSIYAALRDLDKENLRVIVVEGISDGGEGAAVMDRLRRAAAQIEAR